MRRVRARVEGTVQGVGFRPFVYRLASELELAGFVLNDERGVLVEVEGGDRAVDGFLRRLAEEAPPLASVEAVRPRDVVPAEPEVAGQAVDVRAEADPLDRPFDPHANPHDGSSTSSRRR